MVSLIDLSLYCRKIDLPLNDVADFRNAVKSHLPDRIDLTQTTNKFDFVKDYAVAHNFSSSNPHETSYKLRPEKEYFDIYTEEESQFIKNKIDEFGIDIINLSSVKQIPNRKMIDLIKGITAAKQAFKKLPKKIIFKDLPKAEGGYFESQFPNRIIISPTSENIPRACIHEIAHRNDTVDIIASNIPIFCILTTALQKASSKLVLNMNKNEITSQIRKDALINRCEFIAETASMLIVENKNWSDLSPKMQELYKLFLGPKFNLHSK